jgi:hypothetical protein
MDEGVRNGIDDRWLSAIYLMQLRSAPEKNAIEVSERSLAQA